MKRAICMLLVVFAIPGFMGCDRDGPAERTGEKIDEAADKIEDAAD